MSQANEERASRLYAEFVARQEGARSLQGCQRFAFIAAALRRIAPPAFAALAPFWEEDDTTLTCHTAEGLEEHTLAEAIALHID